MASGRISPKLRDDLSALPETLRVLPIQQQKALLSRICSADITARKP
ncbi:MAG: hypothetical protein ACUVTY_05880 [Armatimonadota bacterium]